jgi:UDP-hydrolysing UDP-N-acetyl-D-glucosamine 2-epimerase
VAVVTGTRAEYGLLTSSLRALATNPRLELQVVVTGMHLLRRFGYTAGEIERDGWPIVGRVPMQTGRGEALDQARGLARGVAGIADVLERHRTDVVVVLGDRIEALAGALAAVTTGRCLAHIHGGDVAQGDFDDSLRHAITKLAHVHLAATEAAARRIVRMGEDPARVHVVGAPGLDDLRELLARSEPTCTQWHCFRAVQRGGAPCGRACARGRVRGRRVAPPNFALVVYHAWGRAADVERRVMNAVLRETARAGLRRLVIWPNTDRGHEGVLAAIAAHERESETGVVRVIRSLPRLEYLRALLAADVLVGNSSSGIIEAPLAGTAAVDVGGRQAGREPGGRAVVHSSETPGAIRGALQRALRMELRPGKATVYGDGKAGERIARILAVGAAPPVRKRICY